MDVIGVGMESLLHSFVSNEVGEAWRNTTRTVSAHTSRSFDHTCTTLQRTIRAEKMVAAAIHNSSSITFHQGVQGENW